MKSNVSSWWVGSQAARTSLILLVVIALSQLISSVVWYKHSYLKEEQSLVNSANALSLSAASTIRYFNDLPEDYRHLALNQLRNMGGAKFFVSLNDHAIKIKDIPSSERKEVVVAEVKRIFRHELDYHVEVRASFTLRHDLRVFNEELPIDDLPFQWGHYSMASGEQSTPILVIQAKISSGAWFYVAAPFSQLDAEYLSSQQIFTLILSTILLLLVTWVFFRREMQPIKHLAVAAEKISRQEDNIPLVPISGSRELRSAVTAFNQMHLKVNNFIRDREQLFSAISHDLKTPIACLKLRTEMLDDDREREKFSRIIGDLDLLVKGALQCMKETDIHEDIEPVDLISLIQHCQELYPEGDSLINIQTHNHPSVMGKPLALKRCLLNVIDNGIKYGHRVDVQLIESTQSVDVIVEDHGQGIGNVAVEDLFKPYFRANTEMEGTGLGLTISRSIIRGHGGELIVSKAEAGGLRVVVSFVK